MRGQSAVMMARGSEGPSPVLGYQPPDPQPTTTLAAATRHLRHHHALGAHLAQRDDAPAMILPASKPRAT